MKKTLLILLGLAGFAFGGTSSKEVISEPPPPEPSLWGWFVGGSVGYLFDEYEEEYYTLHVGVDTPWSPAGWNMAFFLEGLYTNPEDEFRIIDPTVTVALVGTDLEVDLEIIPVTFNVKFERKLTGNLGAYFGAGIGAAFVDLDIHADYALGPDLNASSSDTVFAAQVFAGLVYNFTDNFEMFGGARWLYLEDTDDFDLEDDFGAEIGLRFNF